MSLHRLLHILRLALKSIAVHRLRSTLTIMGIVLGVASVIVMLAVGEAARHEAITQIEELGATNIIVRSIKPLAEKNQSRANFMLNYGLTQLDFDRIVSTIPAVKSAVPLREFRKDFRYQDKSLEGRVVGVTPDYLAMNALRLARGRFITELDNQRLQNVCVLGAEVVETLFPTEDPIGRTVHIGETDDYKVVGVMERKATSAGVGSSLAAQDYNLDAYIPFATDHVRFGDMLIRFKPGSREFEKLEISQITVTVDSMDNVKRTADVIRSLLEQFHTQKDFDLTVPLDLLERAEKTQRIFTLVLGSIASIALIVGGIGIMNIMLATVTERTREIGIRRALGAKRRDITWQFLVEAVTLSSAGGLLGVGLGILVSFLVTRFIQLPTIVRIWSPAIAFAVSVAVGLIFGTYPALRAARMDPIEALRHE
jgi:putative ABC transport system permease protein